LARKLKRSILFKMSYYFETYKIKLPREKDRRVKLSERDKKEIKELYFEQGLAIREIARRFKDKCCRRMIQFILFPERYERQIELRKERSWLYYDREKNTKAMREHRRYKYKVLGSFKDYKRKNSGSFKNGKT